MKIRNIYLERNVIYNEYYIEYCQLNPIIGLNLKLYYNKSLFFDIYSSIYSKKMKKLITEYQHKLKDIDYNSLTNKIDQINYLSFDYYLKIEYQKLKDINLYYLPINHQHNIFVDLLDIILKDEVLDLTNLLGIETFQSFLQSFQIVTDSLIKRLEQGIKYKITLPKRSCQILLRQLKSLLNNQVYQNKQIKPQLKPTFSKLMNKYFETSLKKFIIFLSTKYLPFCRSTIGYIHLPNGIETYNFLAKMETSLPNITIEEIHLLGLQEIDRLSTEIKNLTKLKNKNNQTPKKINKRTSTQLVKMYLKQQKNINQTIIPKYFGSLKPSIDYQIKPVPKYLQDSSNLAFYTEYDIDNKDGGTFYFNPRDSNYEHYSQVLSLHEGNPGHHYQLTIANDFNIPKFRLFGPFNAFIEGWGLYSEGLGHYQNYDEYLAKLDMEIHRAYRLVIDTGIHAYNWSFEKSYQYLQKNTNLQNSEIESEIERYIVWPGQALSYKIGQLTFNDLQKQYLKQISGSSLIRFHQTIIKNGPIPLFLLSKIFNKKIT